MTNRGKKLWDILNKYGFSEWRKTRKCLFSDLTALISEHYVAKEEVDKMVSERLREELIAYDKHNNYIKYQYLTDFGDTSASMAVDEYLNTREK